MGCRVIVGSCGRSREVGGRILGFVWCGRGAVWPVWWCCRVTLLLGAGWLLGFRGGAVVRSCSLCGVVVVQLLVWSCSHVAWGLCGSGCGCGVMLVGGCVITCGMMPGGCVVLSCCRVVVLSCGRLAVV